MNLDDLKREFDGQYSIQRAIDILHAQGRILPDGYVAVPLEPTDKMIDAYFNYKSHGETPEEHTAGCYKAMIAAQKVGG